MLGKILKFLWNFFWIALMVTVVGLLAFRFYTLNHYPSFAKGIIPTESLKDNFKSDGSLNAITWRMPEELDEEGCFFAYQPIYIEEEKTFIITVRYNDALLEELNFDGNGESFEMFPSLSYKETERKLPSSYEYGYAYGLYSYRRYVFENVDLSDYEHIYLSIHLDDDYEASPFVILDIYDAAAPTDGYKLTWRDKKALLT